jgi:NADH dehydrogenase
VNQIVVVFGGTGFLGRRAVRHLLDRGFVVRVASRHPERGKTFFREKLSELDLIEADIADDASIREAVTGAFAVVNAISLYVKRGEQTFHSVHVEAAAKLARHSRESAVARLVHVSGIGADAVSSSPYIRSRGEGENAVHAAFPAATIVRPAVMFGPDDVFLIPLLELLRKSPIFPVFGRGQTRLQPAYVEDVGEAIARLVDASQVDRIYEFAGPRTYTYKELLQTVVSHLGSRRALISVPFAIWQAAAFFAEFLPRPFITRNQVELMTIDNVASSAWPGFHTLGIEPHGIEVVLATR